MPGLSPPTLSLGSQSGIAGVCRRGALHLRSVSRPLQAGIGVTLMGSLSIWHWLVVIVVVMLLFGRGKISELMGDVAKGVKSFKKGLADDDEARSRARGNDADGHRASRKRTKVDAGRRGRRMTGCGAGAAEPAQRIDSHVRRQLDRIADRGASRSSSSGRRTCRGVARRRPLTGKAKRMARDFQNQFNEALREAELDDDPQGSRRASSAQILNPIRAIAGPDQAATSRPAPRPADSVRRTPARGQAGRAADLEAALN